MGVQVVTVEKQAEAAEQRACRGHEDGDHGSLDATPRAGTAAVAKIRVEHGTLTAEVAALRKDRAGLTAGIAAVRGACIAGVREVADTAVFQVRRAAAEFERLTGQAAELEPHLRMAQALASTDPAAWRTVHADTWVGLLAHLLRWTDARMVATVEVEPPEAAKRRLEDQACYPHSKGPLRLTLPELVGWLAVALREVPPGGVAALASPSTANGAHSHG